MNDNVFDSNVTVVDVSYQFTGLGTILGNVSMDPRNFSFIILAYGLRPRGLDKARSS